MHSLKKVFTTCLVLGGKTVLIRSKLQYKNCFAAYHGVCIWSHPTIIPEGVSYYACPGENSVTFTCYDVEIISMLWIAAPYIPANDAIIYVSGQIEPGSHPEYSRGPFIAVLTNLTNTGENMNLADLTSDLSFTISEVENETTFICKTYKRQHSVSQKSTTFYHAG